MKKVNVKDLTAANVICAAGKFFDTVDNSETILFAVVNAATKNCGFLSCVNDYRRAYAVEHALENNDTEASFIQGCLQDHFNVNLKQAISYVVLNTSEHYLDADDNATLEHFLHNLCPDVYRDNGKQTLID